MISIKGSIGPWPVDLNIELGPSDWDSLRRAVQGNSGEAAPVPAASQGTAVRRPAPDEALWQNALALVRNAGQVSGPELFEQLEALAGSPAAGKRLLVRLRHCEKVSVLSGADAPLYTWRKDQ